MQSITLQTSDSAITVGDILGRLNFAASSESDGGAAVLQVGSIYAMAEGTFSASANPTSIIIATSASDSSPAQNRIKITNEGHIHPMTNNAYDLGSSSLRYRAAYVNALTINSAYSFPTSDGSANQVLQTDGSGSLSFATVSTGSTYTAGSGLTLAGTQFNVYGGSGNFEYLELQTDDTTIPKIKFTGSGVTDTPISLEVASSFESATGSGSALLFQGTQGQLFSITDNLSSGTIFSVSDITGLPMLEIDASGHVQIGEFADDITIHQPVLLSGGVPSSTTNKLYNNAGDLYWNGSTLTYDDAAISGYFESRVDTNETNIALKANIASPTFTGTPAAPTASAGTNTTQIATTAFVSTAVANLVDSAPTTLDTLNELAAALGDDANFSTTITNSLASKLSDVVDDTTPQLGGGLDINGYDITGNGSINISGIMTASGERVITSDEIYHIRQLTQAEYDAITPNAATFYIITDPDVEGPVVQPIKTVTSDYTILTTDYTLYATSGLTLTLPSAIGNGGILFNIKSGTSSTVYVSGVSSQTIDGQNPFSISTPYQSVTLQSTNSNWIIV